MMRDNQQGISNRETAAEEAEERKEFPPVTPDAPPVEQDAAGREGAQPVEDFAGSQTSHKAGSRSVAQKEAESKYADRGPPASRKVAGADGQEPSQDVGRSADADSPRPEGSGG
jgi:hypothetical protein